MRLRLERNFIVDAAVTIFVPILIMILIGSLIYFLLDIRTLYVAESPARLKFVMFMYIMACVLINRIAVMYASDGTAAVYGFFLALAIFAFMLTYTGKHGAVTLQSPFEGMGFELITNLFIVALVWWTANGGQLQLH